ncbi:hypothetical protein DFH09DRAFT_1392884 [Mycena vulgaris]|nr:hypothetical protein DFH09DRAFT_1392884 [Mycena vulgaris]
MERKEAQASEGREPPREIAHEARRKRSRTQGNEKKNETEKESVRGKNLTSNPLQHRHQQTLPRAGHAPLPPVARPSLRVAQRSPLFLFVPEAEKNEGGKRKEDEGRWGPMRRGKGKERTNYCSHSCYGFGLNWGAQSMWNGRKTQRAAQGATATAAVLQKVAYRFIEKTRLAGPSAASRSAFAGTRYHRGGDDNSDSCRVRSSAALGATRSASRMRWRSRSRASFSCAPSPRLRKRHAVRRPPLDEEVDVELELACEAEDAADGGRSTESDLERRRWAGDWKKRGSLDVPVPSVGDVGEGAIIEEVAVGGTRAAGDYGGASIAVEEEAGPTALWRWIVSDAISITRGVRRQRGEGGVEKM